jgi:hypothetical protein
MKVWVLLFLMLLSVFIIKCSSRENLEIVAYQRYDDTEFRGMNMMGVNSNDTHVAAASEKDCQGFCADNNCRGYSYYEPGNRCYIYSSGGFVFGRKGYKSGLRV